MRLRGHVGRRLTRGELRCEALCGRRRPRRVRAGPRAALALGVALTLSAVAAAPVRGAPATPFDLSLLPDTRALWLDGAAHLAAASSDGTVRLLGRADTEATVLGSIESPPAAIGGRGTGAGMALAVCGRGGAAGRWLDGRWSRSHAPTTGQASFIGAAIDAHGKVWCAGDRAIHVWHDHLWDRVSYPTYDTHVAAFALGDAGQVLATGPSRAVLTLDPDAPALIPPGAPLGPRLSGSFPAVAWSTSEQAFWLAGANRGLHLANLDQRSVQRFDDVPTGSPRRLAVADLDGHDLVAITDGERLTLFQDGATRVLDRPVDRPWLLVVDAAAGHLYLSSPGGLAALSLAPYLQHAATSSDRRLVAGPTSTQRDAAAARLRGGGMLLRTAMGPMWKVAPTRADAAFALDLVLRVRFTYAGDGAGFVFWPAAGYTYEDTKQAGHLATIGRGLGYGDHVFTVAWVPRFVIGEPDGALAAGWRHGLYGELLWGMFHVELAHQILWPGGDARHDLRLNFGVDLLAVARAFGVFSFLTWMGAL